jgi:simple sugar transport system permease protein
MDILQTMFSPEALVRALSFGTPLLLASLGAIVNERSGVVNLGVEGMMAVGALAAFSIAYGGGTGGNLWLAVLLAMLVGASLALLHAFVTITLKANQFVSGLALTMLGLGISGLLGKRFEGMPLFNQAAEWPFVVTGIAVALGLSLLFYTTRVGLVLRSTGENPAAVDVLGINVLLVRYIAVALGGALAGLAGAFLSIAYRPSWTDGMTAGLGWIAVALVIFVGWNPLRAIAGAVFFGWLYFLQFALQGKVPIPTEFFSLMPYLLVIVVLALTGIRSRQGAAPEALGRPYNRGER